MPRLTAARREDGFTMAEMLVASAIVVAAVAAFAVFMSAVAGTQRSADLERIAMRAVGQEMETLNGIGFDHLLTSPGTGLYADCVLPGGRISTQAVNPGPSTVIADDIEISITRDVTWATTGTPATCATADSADMKQIAITATWLDGGQTRSHTVTTLRAPGLERVDDPSGASAPTLLVDAPLSEATWCAGNLDATAATTATGLAITWTAPGDCALQVTGLTAGTTYTAVLAVTGTETSPATWLRAVDAADGSTTSGAGSRELTVTWTETGTARTLALAAAAAGGLEATSLRIYQH